jgi:hypothetical protein
MFNSFINFYMNYLEVRKTFIIYNCDNKHNSKLQVTLIPLQGIYLQVFKIVANKIFQIIILIIKVMSKGYIKF